jgi:hypothetical protein
MLALALSATTSCAGVWGFDPLSLAPAVSDGGDASFDINVHEPSDARAEPGGGDGSPCANCDDAPNASLACQSSNGMCTCAVNTPANGAPCSPASLGVEASNVVCCADPVYPASGSCTCQWIGCTMGNGNCICAPLNGTPGGSCAPGSWTCCLQSGASQCLCSALACQTGFTPFGNACGIGEVKCPGAQRKVSVCN